MNFILKKGKFFSLTLILLLFIGCGGDDDEMLPEVVASFTQTIDPTSGTVPLEVSFDASASVPPDGATITDYDWDFGDGNTSTDVTATYTYSTEGTFTATLTVTDSNGCIGSTNEFVNEATELSPVISGDLDYCFGLSTTLDAGSGFATYNWSNGETGSSILVTMPGIYTLDVTDAGGCAGTATVEVIENPLPTPTITGDFDYCAGLSTDITVNPEYES